MNVPKERIEAARRLVEDVLSGRITPANSPAVFDDDVLYIQVGMLEQLDTEWLRGRLAQPADDEEGKRLVVRCVNDPQSLMH